MKKYDYILGIDPDSEKSGLAVLEIATKQIHVEAIVFPKLVDFLRTSVNLYPNMLLVVEAGWLNGSNWHLNPRDTKAMAAAKGNAVGRNHEVARKIAEMARYYGLEVKEVKPLKKCWLGKDGKITHEEITSFIPGLQSRTNQEMRDSILLCWVEAGLPIRMKSLKRA